MIPLSSFPKVTLVIPTFNQARYLPACVDHCLFQSYPNLEIIIVDGGSRDQTGEYLEGLGARIRSQSMEPVTSMSEEGEVIRTTTQVYPQNRELTIITFPEDIGPTRTYNEGLKRATGTYCSYIVGDDLPHPQMVEEMVGHLEATQADFVYADQNLVDDQGRIVRQMRFPDYDFKTCLADWYHLGVCRLYRRSLHEQVGLMDESFQAANDYYHYLRFAMAGCKFTHLAKVLYSVRYHGPQRPVGQHTPNRYQTLLNESKKCAFRARAWLAEQNSQKAAPSG